MLDRFVFISLTRLLFCFCSVQFCLALVADQAATAASPSLFSGTRPQRKCTSFRKKGKQGRQRNCKQYSYIHMLWKKMTFFFSLVLIVSFSKMGKSEHPASSHRENESKAAAHFNYKLKEKILYHWRSFAARQKTKKKSHGCLFVLALSYPSNTSSFFWLSVTNFFFCLLLFLCISISSGATCPSSATARNVLEKVECCSASQPVGWNVFRTFDIATQRPRRKPTLYPESKSVFSSQWQHSKLFFWEVFRINKSDKLLNSLPVMPLCEEELQKNRIARQHYYKRLLVRW